MTEEQIFKKSPGFYKEKNNWYTIIHLQSSVTDVQLIGDFTDWISKPVILKKIPSGKFWYFKGKDYDFNKIPGAGNKYKFRISYNNKTDWIEIQDPAARQVENSSPKANSIVTISSNYRWQDKTLAKTGLGILSDLSITR